MRVGVARNDTLGPKWIYYVPKGILWTIGQYTYFGLLYSCILLEDKCLLGLSYGYADILMEQWCQ